MLAAEGLERPQWVAEMMEGRRHEARVSWWGFDEHDSTAFLQEAIDSKVKRLIIDRQPSPWVTRPLTGVSGREIVFRGVDCNGNHRQGISVISAENLLIEDCLLRNTAGTAPHAGSSYGTNAELLAGCPKGGKAIHCSLKVILNRKRRDPCQ